MKVSLWGAMVSALALAGVAWAGSPQPEALKQRIMYRVASCWHAPASAADCPAGENPRCRCLLKKPVVTVQIALDTDGKLLTVGVAPAQASRYKQEALYREFVNSALKAVRDCQPYSFLPPGRYANWRDMELIFDISASCG